MGGASDGASTVASSSADILTLSVAQRFITMPRLRTEIIEDSLPRMAHSERGDFRIAARADLAQPRVTDMRAHLEVSPAVIAAQPLTGALKATEPTQAIGDSPAANGVSRDADQARRAPVASAATAAVSRADPLRMQAPAVRAAAGMPAADTAAVAVTAAARTVAVVVTAAADTAASAKYFV
jgi:hypothetical protein